MAASLFPQHSASAGGRGGHDGPNAVHTVLSFKAGKCEMSRNANGKYSVTADKRRGTISLCKTISDGGMMHFRWSDRSSGQIEDDRIIFPQDIEFKRVNTGRGDTDRVYFMQFGGSVSGGLMFWMQEKSSEKDVENCARVNELANSPAAVDAAITEAREARDAAARAAATAAAAAGGGAGGDMAGLLASLGAARGGGAAGGGTQAADWRALMGLPEAPPPADHAAPALTPFNLDLSSIIGAIGGTAPAAPAAAAASSSSSSSRFDPLNVSIDIKKRTTHLSLILSFHFFFWKTF